MSNNNEKLSHQGKLALEENTNIFHRNHVFLMRYTEYLYRELNDDGYTMEQIQKYVYGFAPLHKVTAFFDALTLEFGKWLLQRNERTLEHSMEDLLLAFKQDHEILNMLTI